MSSAICQNFVQNAWKKDLCSNCFKSKDEHNLQTPSKVRSNQISVKKSIGGIIKSKSSSSKRPKRSVGFTKQLIEVIGFGGEDSFSDSEETIEDEEEESDEETEEVFEGDAEKELRKLTKANTEFNANLPVNVEVNGTVETKKSYTQLLLGKPQLDSEGKKQTLLVSVTPFGQTGSNNNNNNNNNVKKYNGSVSHIPVAKNLPKENLLEPKGSNYAPSNVILTSYTTKNPEKEKSLLDEISETLENSKNPIQIISNPTNNRKKSETELILSKPDFDNNNKENVDDSKTELKPKSTDSIPEIRKNSLSRTPVIKKDQEKPTIYQTSTAKIDLITTKSLNTKSAISSKETKPTETLIKNDPIVAKIDSDKEKKQEEVKEEEISDASLTSTVSSCEESDRSCEEESVKIIPELAIPSQNREQPDGQADVEETEPPALPLTPPPNFDSTHNNSFLHGQLPKHQQQPDKPKIPCKPSTILIRKQLTNTNSKISPIDSHPPPILTTFISSSSEVLTKPKVFSESLVSKPKFVKLEKQDSGSNKRKAPKPPNLIEDLELNKRNLNLGKFDDVCINSYRGDVPEPLPRRSLSLSSDNLLSQSEEKKKRARFSLKKFLRMGNNSKNLNSNNSEIQQKPISEEPSIPPQIKPRLVIVHPSELNGDKVEVLSKNLPSKDVPDYSNSNLLIKSDVPKPSMKPAPPPRNYDDYNNPKPNLPHPPKSQEIINKQKEFLKNPNIKKTETVYANIGEVRSALTPNKPHRTASMREREAQQQKAVNNNNNYENVGRKSSGSPSNDENYYDYINNRSSSPECDSKNINNNGANRGGLGQKSESNIDISSENYYVNHKYQMIPRSLSLTYCGSETESEIYSPYSFCGSESEVADDDHEQWILSGKTHKLRSKKGRSIVHKNLEDNYGAVVVANHEALAQVLENIQQSVTVQPALRGLKTSPSLRWADFTIKGSAQSVAVGPRAFHQAIWGAHHHVTLMVSVATTAPATSISPGVSAVAPITEFCDLVPVQYLPERDGPDANEDAKHLQATVAVLPWTQIHTIESYGELLKSKGIDEHWKDASFILLQLVNALKVLQAQGIEELPSSLSSFVLCREVDKDAYYRLYVLQGLGEDLIRKTEEEPSLTLCSCASLATSKLSASSRISSLIQNLLKNERAVSLTQTKSVLEFSLWGPSDVSLSNTIKEREMALQRWLDLQRATVLHGLVCAKIQLNVYEECHLMFLVRSTARMMSDASLLVESSNKQK